MRKSKEHFRHEWKYLINRAEKQLTDLRLRECMQLDPHAGEGGYMIRSLYFDDYWNSAYEEKEAGILIFLISKAIPLPKRRGIIYVSKYQNFTP